MGAIVATALVPAADQQHISVTDQSGLHSSVYVVQQHTHQPVKMLSISQDSYDKKLHVMYHGQHLMNQHAAISVLRHDTIPVQ